MKQFKKLTLTLALLITAVTGAWAAQPEETLLTTIESTANNTFKSGSKTFDDIATVTFGAEVKNDGDNWGWYTMGSNDVTLTVTAASDAYTITRVKFYSADGSAFDEEAPFLAIVRCESGSSITKVNGTRIGMWGVTKIEVYGYEGSAEPAGPEVTITGTSAEGQQASFQMPQNDVTVTYTLKRDLSVETQVTVGDDHSAQPRYRVQKQGNTFQPVGMTTAEVMALFHVHDQIENQDLTATEDYTVLIYAVDIEGQPTGDAIPFQNFTYAPGQYIVKAQGQGNYVGQTTESNVFTLYQGYPVEIAAQSFATYYSEDEALTLEESFAETAGLYTVSEVTATEAVLSEKIDVMPKRTPMLIYNESADAQTVLLIPTADVAPLTDVAAEFKGTAVEKTVSADEVAATNFYVLTDQNQFVWVKDAGTIAAHRCWLEIAPSQAQAARRIVFSGSGTTGVESLTPTLSEGEGDWYDLNGRKINMPTKKGIYIQNGKKVVVK